MNHDADYHVRREWQERECAANAMSSAARAIHMALADRHADRTRGLREEAAAFAQAIHSRLMEEAIVESEREATASTERRERALKGIGGQAAEMVITTIMAQAGRTVS